MHACGVCTFLNAHVWKREKEGERNHIFGEITSRMWYWVHFTDGNRGILSALPRSGNEGQIVLVVWKWVRNNPSKVKKLVNRDYCVFMPLNKEKLPMTISIKLDFWTPYTFFFTLQIGNVFLLGPFKTFMPYSSNALQMEPCVSSHHMYTFCVFSLISGYRSFSQQPFFGKK